MIIRGRIDSWAPDGFKVRFRKLAREPASAEVLFELLLLIGYQASTDQIETWPLRARIEAEAYAVNAHLRASDNVMREFPRPEWFPQAWEGEQRAGVWGPSPTPLPSPAWGDASVRADIDHCPAHARLAKASP